MKIQDNDNLPDEPDVRWKQRYENYVKALAKLQEAEKIIMPSELEKTGIVQCFEFTHELAWNVMKDFLEYRGNTKLTVFGSRDAARLAFNSGLIQQGTVWMSMIETRNKTVHAYNVDVLTEDVPKILEEYLPLFETFAETMKQYL